MVNKVELDFSHGRLEVFNFRAVIGIRRMITSLIRKIANNRKNMKDIFVGHLAYL